MANHIFTSDFLVPAAIQSATTTASGFRAMDLLVVGKPFRVWRSTSASGQAIVFDFGASVTVAGIYWPYANFTTLAYTAGATTAGTGDTLGTRTLYLDELVQRYKGLHLVTMSTPRRYLKAAISGVLGGAAYVEAGGPTFITAAGMTPIGYALGFPDYAQPQDLERLTVASQVAVRGRPYLRMGLGQPHLRRSVSGSDEANRNHLRTLLAKAKHTPHLLSENREQDGDGTTRFAWLMLLDTDEPRHSLTKPTISPDTFVMREVIE